MALHTDPRVSTGVFAIFAIGITATNAMNLYCGALSTITVARACFRAGARRWQPRSDRDRAVRRRDHPALVSAEDFLANYANFLALLLCVLIPWTAVNLVDYYLPAARVYDIASLFRTRRRQVRQIQLDRHRLLLHRDRRADPVPVDDPCSPVSSPRRSRCRHLVDRRPGRHLPAVLRADAARR